MAFLDFLNKPTGGYQQAAGPNMTGGAGVGPMQPQGPTYGDMLKAGMQLGSKPSSSAPLIAGQMNTSPLQPLQPTTMMQTPQEKNPQEDSLSQILAIFTKLFGI